MPEENKKLNAEQTSAIEHTTGPLLIIAGAGTGKTTVITQRVQYLINQKLVTPEEILCLTFTEKAAREMQERIDAALPYGYSQMWITTFHSFCDRILRDEALNIGLDPSYKLLTDTDIVTLIQKYFFDFSLDYYRPLGNPQKFIAAMLQHVSRLNDEDITWEHYLNWAEKVPDVLEKKRYLELANFYKDYEHLKIKHSFMDFSNLIAHALKLFRTRPNVLSQYQKKFKYILVDEFQDTNFAQNQLVNLFAGTDQNLTVVADDDQAIYRWRGAAVSNVIQFRTTYSTAKLIVLTQNYRSTQEILDRSYDLIQHNNPDRLEVAENIQKKLTSVRKLKGEKVKFLHYEKVDQEAEGVAKKIKELLSTKDTTLTPKDIAVLVRANAHAEPFVRAFARFDIPHQFLGPSKLFHQPEVKDLIAYLQVLENFSDNPAFFRVLSSPFFALSPRDLSGISNFAKKANTDLFEACEIVLGILPKPNTAAVAPIIGQDTKDTLTQIITSIHNHLGKLTTSTAAQLLYDFLSSTGMLQAIIDDRPPFNEGQAQNIIKFFDKIKSYETIHPDAFVPQVLEWLRLAAEMGESPMAGEPDWSGQDAVNILTIHSSKGLEFPVVFLVNLVSQRFPSTARREQIPIPDELVKEIMPSGDFHLQEERRLMYVGITRARDQLFITAADYYGDAKRQKKLSPFIAETLGTDSAEKDASITSQLSLLDYYPSTKSPVPQVSSPLKVDYLSYSQIQTFTDCPLHYKLKYILKIPTPPSAASSFGTTIHATLKEFYQKKGQADILELYKKLWTSDGYLSKDHEKSYFAKGERYLSEYVEHEFDPHLIPIKLEEPFMAPITTPDLKRFMKIGGKIDRVDLHPDGTLEIIDYKTSEKITDQKEADVALQLSFYSLAASTLQTPPFGVSPEKIKLTLYFFEGRQKVSTVRTAAQLEHAKAEIFAAADEIMASEFKCSGSMLCKMCDYRLLCDVESKAEA